MGASGQEEWMPHSNPQDQTPVYTFQVRSPAEELQEIARMYNKEAKLLFTRAEEALAEDRQEEARLLMDQAIALRARADEFVKAAREEGSDPIVAEILEHQQSQRKNYTSYTPTYAAPDEELPESWLEEEKPRPLGRIARAVAWVGSWITG
jgi:acyl-CoA reductase-like NAD-dependent aldehyde dehydrogenase